METAAKRGQLILQLVALKVTVRRLYTYQSENGRKHSSFHWKQLPAADQFRSEQREENVDNTTADESYTTVGEGQYRGTALWGRSYKGQSF